MMLRLSLLLSCLGLAAPAAAQVSADRLMYDVRALADDAMQGRRIDTGGSARARRYLTARLQQIGVRPVGTAFAHPFTTRDDGKRVDGVNLLAMVPGRRGGDGPIMVLGAHYDHLGIRKGQVYNGADDNASGVAGLLAIAEALVAAPPEHDVLLALWDGEEPGLFGAKAFVAAPPVPLRRIALNINLDMIGRGDKGELYAVGGVHWPAVKPVLDALATTGSVTLRQGHEGPGWEGDDDWTDGSDHAVFHAAGIPFVYFGVEDHPDYHKAGDDADKIPVPFFAGAVETILAAVRRYDAVLETVAR